MRILTVSLCSLLVVGGGWAQRPIQTEVSSLTPAVTSCFPSQYYLSVMTACPGESLPAPACTGCVPTGDLAYSVWRTDSGSDSIEFARSTDSGRTWATSTVYSVPGAETISSIQIGAEGSTVFVLFLSDLAGQMAPWNLYMIGSEDQGQNWSPPVLVNPVSAAAGDAFNYPAVPQMDVTRDPTSTNVRAHIVFEFGDNRNPTPLGWQGEEKPHYTAIEMTAGTPTTVVAEKDLASSVLSTQNPDVDNVSLEAEGGTVMVCYRSDRLTFTVAGTSHNQVFGTVSTDGGATFAPDFLLKATAPNPQNVWINAVTGLSNNDCLGENMAIDGANLYFIWCDRSHNQGPLTTHEPLAMVWSNDSGATWQEKFVTTFTVGTADIDEHSIKAENGVVWIAVTSDEQYNTLSQVPVSRNDVDGAKIFVSTDAGGTFTEQWLSSLSLGSGDPATASLPAPYTGTNWKACKNIELAVRGSTVIAAWDEVWYTGIPGSPYLGDDVVMAHSTDFGLNWSAAVNVTHAAGQAQGFGYLTAPPPPTTTPVAYWPFDSDFSSVTTVHNGNPIGNVSITNVAGEFVRGTGALKVDDSNNGSHYVNVTTSPFPAGITAYTAMAWYKFDDISGNGSDTRNFIFETEPTYSCAASIRDTDSGYTTFGTRDVEWFCNTVGAIGNISNSYWGSTSGPVVVPAGGTSSAWHHVAIVFDQTAGHIAFYHDGVAVDDLTVATGVLETVNGFHIGDYRSGTGGRNWDGFIDDVAVFAYEVSATEINDIFTGVTSISAVPLSAPTPSDTDNPRLSMTGSGLAVVGFRMERNGLPDRPQLVSFGVNPDVSLGAAPNYGSTLPVNLYSATDPNLPYVSAFALSNTPPIELVPGSGIFIDLAPDLIFAISIDVTHPLYPVLFQDTIGVLDGAGKGTAYLAIPNDPSLGGLGIYTAFIGINPALLYSIGAVSDSLFFTIL
ncbi:MAG: hypothetical protein CMJ83_11035 [Planctomycetes bacterium]|nr:hypothetical protein [Planctomycetota bacterium]